MTTPLSTLDARLPRPLPALPQMSERRQRAWEVLTRATTMLLRLQQEMPGVPAFRKRLLHESTADAAAYTAHGLDCRVLLVMADEQREHIASAHHTEEGCTVCRAWWEQALRLAALKPFSYEVQASVNPIRGRGLFTLMKVFFPLFSYEWEPGDFFMNSLLLLEPKSKFAQTQILLAAAA